MIKFSILILSLEKRKDNLLKRLLDVLETQKTDEVEILINSDDGTKYIGKKRNELLAQAKGQYVAFVDDDDLVSSDYVSKILDAINKSNPDVIGMHLIMTTDKVIEEKTFHSLKYKSWFDEPDPDRPWLKRYYRNPNHLNPVKRELALETGYPDSNTGEWEDRYYSRRLLPHLKTEEYIEQPIYYYDFRTKK